MNARSLAAAGAMILAGVLATAARAQDTLRVCLDENVPPYSVRHGRDGSGFDVAVAEAVAKRLGKTLAVQWFESKIDTDSSTTLAANALLSDRRCQLVAGYPLVGEALGKPGAETARMPDYDGATPADRRRRVVLGALVPSKPYHYAPLTVVLGPGVTKPITRLADLEDLKLVVEAATLADAILMSFGNGRLVNRITHLVPGRRELLPRLEQGGFDATLIPLHRFDAYRAEHPQTALKPSGYYHRVGFNMGFVGLSSEAPLIDQVSAAIGDMLAGGDMPALAEKAGMTHLPPRQPDVRESLSLADLRE
jgi:ABC-type amino acid transport substrate-binding protein